MRLLILSLAALTMLVAAACGDDDDDDDDDAATATATAATTEPAATTTAVVGSLAVSALDEVESAVVRIVAEGSFIDPQLGARTNVAGSGSGFLIDESGIAVTNNHVVAGAAFIQVFVGGDNRPRNARVLGVSECSDLAVIDIDGEGYPFLEWFDGALSVGTEVYVAGSLSAIRSSR